MSRSKILKRMSCVATLAALFGAASVYAQTSQSPAGTAKENQAGATTSTGNQSSGASSTPSSAATSGSSGSSQNAGGSVSKTDQRMMQEIAYANIAEIEAGKLAQGKTQNDQVKAFAQQMIDDHTKALQELQQVAQAKGVTLPTQPDKKHQAMAKKLSALSGDAFDRRYMAQGGLADHKQAHRLLQRVQSRATDPDLKALAAKTLPTVEQHLNMAQQLQGGKARGTGAASTSSGTGAMGSGTSGSATPGGAAAAGSSGAGTSSIPGGSDSSSAGGSTAGGAGSSGTGGSASGAAGSSGTGGSASGAAGSSGAGGSASGGAGSSGAGGSASGGAGSSGAGGAGAGGSSR